MFWPTSYFGTWPLGAAPLDPGTGPVDVGPPGFVPGVPVVNASQVMDWMAGSLRASGIFGATGTIDGPDVRIGRNANNGPMQVAPRAWIYPVGFDDRNDGNEASTRTVRIAVNVSVVEDLDDPAASYYRLEGLATAISDRLELGPDGTIPELGGLLSGAYDPPGGKVARADVGPPNTLAVVLVFAYAFLRDKGATWT